MSSFDLVCGYYAALDAGDYDALASMVTADFVHYRPDRTLSGRETFVDFMHSSRPQTETTHRLDALYTGETDEVVARGRLLTADGDLLFRFVDVHALRNGTIASVRTFTNCRSRRCGRSRTADCVRTTRRPHRGRSRRPGRDPR